MYNDYGCKELLLQATIGDFWTPRYRYMHLLEIPYNQWVQKTYMKSLGRPLTRGELMGYINHRTVCDIEVMLDVDDTHHHFFDFTTIKEKAKFIYHFLRKEGKDVKCFFTGSKSYHISYLDPELRMMSTQMRREHKLKVIERFCCDPDLANDNHMIALEYAKHYKSGKIKVLCLIIMNQVMLLV